MIGQLKAMIPSFVVAIVAAIIMHSIGVESYAPYIIVGVACGIFNEEINALKNKIL